MNSAMNLLENPAASPRRDGWRKIGLSVAVVVLSASLGACSHAPKSAGGSTDATGGSTTSSSTGGTSSGSKSTTTTRGGTETNPTSGYPSGHLIQPPDTSTTTPREGSGKGLAVGPAIGAGQQILIEPGGAFWPATLYANYELPVTWTNLSGKPQTVNFYSIPVKSETIQPGWQFEWKWISPGTLSYHLGSGNADHGEIYFQAPTPVTLPPTPTT